MTLNVLILWNIQTLYQRVHRIRMGPGHNLQVSDWVEAIPKQTFGWQDWECISWFQTLFKLFMKQHIGRIHLEAHFSLSKCLARTSFKTLVRGGHRPTCLDHCAKTFETLYSQTYDFFFLLSKISQKCISHDNLHIYSF